MFTIRLAQLAAIGEARVESFKDRLAAHLRQAFPDQTGALDDAALQDVAALAHERAREHGIVSERGVASWAELMLRYGRDFHNDPQLPFDARILQERKVYRRQPRIDKLLELEDKVAALELPSETLGLARRHARSPNP